MSTHEAKILNPAADKPFATLSLHATAIGVLSAYTPNADPHKPMSYRPDRTFTFCTRSVRFMFFIDEVLACSAIK